MKSAVWGLCVPAFALAQQSSLQPSGENARHIKSLGIFFVGLLAVIFVVVLGLALFSLARRHRGIDQEQLEATHHPSASTEKKLTTVVGIATALTVLILLGLVIVSVEAGRATSLPSIRSNSLTIEVTGNQWWWKVTYPNDNASRIITTANEIHIPVGRQVMIRGTANDVIHSFWVPSLQGKRDLIPGHVTTEWIEADRPGRFRGQCAEFCGLQHAHMALWVVADSKDQFEAWMTNQLQPAPEPSDRIRARGKEVFLNSSCVLCHAIEGTSATAQVGPDLTHFASRLTIAAGTLANNMGNVAGWIADPQNIKPGTHMATVSIKPGDMQPLLEYLESLR
jgi:cytochrome c oxidase subunit II